MKKLNNIPIGSLVKVEDLLATEMIREKMIAFGLTKGARVEVVRRGPSGDPTIYEIRGAMIALRKEDAAMVMVSEPN